MSKRKLSPWQRGWITRRAHEAEREREREQQRRSDAARRGWERRRQEEAARARAEAQRARYRAAVKGIATRRRHETERAEKEARRLAKWRKSFREYLKFRVPKKEREALAVPEKRELVCKVLFDSDETDPREEHFWSNVRQLLGDSISNQLARIPADDGVIGATFRLIAGEDMAAMRAGTMEESEDAGELVRLEWETGLSLEEFWPAYFENARSLLPDTADKERDSSNYNAVTLLLIYMQVCYGPGQVSPH